MSDREAIKKGLDDLEYMVANGKIEPPALFTVMKQMIKAAQAQAGEAVAEMDERMMDLSERLRATDSVTRYLSLSEQHEICDFIDGLPYGPLYTAPPAAAVNQQLLEALQHIMKMQTFGYLVLGDEATTKARAAIAAAQEQK